jgi:N-formylglutamate amidohydrolase
LEQEVLTSCIGQASNAPMVEMIPENGEPSRDQVGVPCGLLPGDSGLPAFELVQRRPSPIPVLIAVPHAGRSYPADLLAAMRNPQEACIRLEDRFADLVARQVAQQTGAALLVAHAPRAMIDLNRAPEDMDWDMVAGPSPRGVSRFGAGRRARSGLGLVPRRLPALGELWRERMAPETLEARLELVHRPYHATLGQVLESLRDRWGSAVLVDLHSMPPLGLKTGSDPSADFVVGDRYGSSCAAHLSAAAIDYLGQAGWRVAHNRPYAGGYVLDRHSAPQRGIHAVQLEMCRATYLDAELRQPGDGLDQVVDAVAGLVRHLAGELSTGWQYLPQAAE